MVLEDRNVVSCERVYNFGFFFLSKASWKMLVLRLGIWSVVFWHASNEKHALGFQFLRMSRRKCSFWESRSSLLVEVSQKTCILKPLFIVEVVCWDFFVVAVVLKTMGNPRKDCMKLVSGTSVTNLLETFTWNPFCGAFGTLDRSVKLVSATLNLSLWNLGKRIKS